VKLRPTWSALGALLRQRPRATRVLSDRQTGLITIMLGVAAVTAASLSVFAALPDSAIQLPRPVTQVAQELAPQGWAFFTASPETVYPQVYLPSRTGGWQARGGSIAIPSDLFGLDRSLRAQGTEIALLLQGVPARAWRSCGNLPSRCLSAAPVAIHLINTSTLDDLCGDVGFVRQQVLPWAWRGTGTVMPSLVLRTEVSCQ